MNWFTMFFFVVFCLAGLIGLVRVMGKVKNHHLALIIVVSGYLGFPEMAINFSWGETAIMLWQLTLVLFLVGWILYVSNELVKESEEEVKAQRGE